MVTPQKVAGQPRQHDISQLTAPVETRLKKMQYRPGLLDGFLASTRLDLTTFYSGAELAVPHGPGDF